MLRARLSQTRSEDGYATETAIVFPIVLIAILLAIQFGLAYHAQHVALAAAQEGARAVRMDGGTEVAGQARALQFVTDVGGSVISNPQVSVIRSSDWVRVSVSGQVISLVPGLTLTLPPQVAQGPVERFRGVGP